MNNMEELLQKRIRLRQDRLEQCIASTKEVFDSGMLDYNNAKNSITKLREFVEKLEGEVKYYTERSAEPNSQIIDTAMNAQLMGEDLLIDLQAATNDAAVQSAASEGSNNAHSTTIKLPKFELTKYSGDRLRWSEFWDRFNTNVHKKNISDADKLAYLMSCLEGSAMEAVAGLTITSVNYAIALEALKRRFGSKDELVDAHYLALNKLPRAEYNAVNCRTTLDEVERHLRILEELGEASNGNHFRAMVLSKFPDRVVHEYHLTRQDSENNMASIRKCLQKIVTAMESSLDFMPLVIPVEAGSTTEALHITTETAQSSTAANRQAQRPNRKRKSTNETDGPRNKKSRLPCLFCNLKNHTSADCRKYKTLESRKQKLAGRCFKCLQRNHNTKECKKNIKCFRCEGDHIQLLCPTPKGEIHNDSMLNSVEYEKLQTMFSNHTTFLQTAVVKIKNPHNKKELNCRLVLDSGSQRSYITEEIYKRLGLSADNDDLLLVYTFGASTPKEMSTPATELTVITKRGITRQIKVNVVPHITDRIPIAEIINKGIDLPADDDSTGERINLLIGNDYYASFIHNKKIELNDNLYAIDTDFGWVLSGVCQNTTANKAGTLTVATYCQCHNASCPYFTEPDLPLRNIDIRFLWSLECIGITDSPKTTHQEEAVKHFNDTVKYQSGRYEVKWPWIEYPPPIPSNFGLALGRLKSLLNRSSMDILEEYDSILKEQLELGIIEQVEPHVNNQELLHYLPHHMVKQFGKRGRIVYDASAKTSGQKSLNECLYSGPSMLEDLTALLLKFRTKRIGIVADVEKAFLQVGLQPADRDVTRFLWVKDVSKGVSEKNLLYLRFCRVPFGIVSSPFLLTATIRHHMSRTNEDLLKTVADKCYVDNLVTCANSVAEARQTYEKTRETFDQISMNIRDWVSNDADFMNTIPKQHQAIETETVKILGLLWNVKKDTLELKVNDDHFKTSTPIETKRNVLRALARIYDPCGFVCPLILPLKLLFRKICEQKYKWDAKLHRDLTQSLEKLLEDLRAIMEVQLPRCIGGTSDLNTKYELHCFSDASYGNAYAAVVYLRVTQGNETNVSFVMAKSHLANNKDKTDLKIPRLELMGFLIASRLIKYVKENIDLPIDKEVLWTDSLVVLGWIHSNKLLPPFVANRVEEIKKSHELTSMFYVNTKCNPADIATKPGSWENNKELWMNGPEFLKMDESCWPKDRYYDSHRTLLSCWEALEQSPEEEQLMEIDDELVESELPCPSVQNEEEVVKSSPSCLLNQEIKQIQQLHFPEEISGKRTHLARNLDLFLDVDGILRCKGRMANTLWSYDMKYPILLPKESELTNNIIKAVHESNYHVGAAHTLSIIREKYWIPQGKVQVQKIIRRCPQCVKHGGGPYQLPHTPALPAERVNYSPPWTFTGLDYFGPVYVNTKNGKEKRWVALFTCLAVRSISLEIVNDLSAEECLLALRRFSATRNTPTRIYSDNAKYFKLISEVLNKSHCVERGIQWKFIPQLAPWHGGFYERLVGLVKHCLKRTLDKHLLNDSKLLTIMKEVEAVVNSRPLAKIGTEVEHILRPADFLSLGKCVEIEPSSIPNAGTTIKVDLIQSWKRGLKILEEFKKMFIGQYLSSVRERFKHTPKQPRVRCVRKPQVGDLVQIRSEAKNRNNWKVGKIVELLRGADEECRVARVKTDESILTRSIGHLYPLETDICEDDQVNIDNPVGNSALRVVEQPEEQEVSVPCEVASQEGSAPTPTVTAPEPIQLEDISVVNEEPPVSSDAPEKVRTTTESEVAPEEVHQEVEGRSTRQAAVRAREKILEWTRHLLTLLH